VWGHHTSPAPEVPIDRDFTNNWTLSGTATIEGTPGNDDETIKLYSGDSAISETWYTGSGVMQIFRDKYRTGAGDLVIEYKTGIDGQACENDTWHTYNGISFVSTNYVKVKISRS